LLEGVAGSSIVNVPRTRHVRVVLVLAIALRTIYAVPAYATAQLRAASCCAHCTHGDRTRPERCCQIACPAGDAALLSSTPRPSALTVSPLPAAAPIQALSLVAPVAGVEFGGDGPPLFLRTHALRL